MMEVMTVALTKKAVSNAKRRSFRIFLSIAAEHRHMQKIFMGGFIEWHMMVICI